MVASVLLATKSKLLHNAHNDRVRRLIGSRADILSQSGYGEIMSNDPLKDISRETFDAWAAHLGLDIEPEHLNKLYPETLALLKRMSAVHLVDVSEVDPIEATETVPREMSGSD